MSTSIITPYSISIASGLEFYPSAGSPLYTRLVRELTLADDFNTDPTSRWSVLTGSFSWDSSIQYKKTVDIQVWHSSALNSAGFAAETAQVDVKMTARTDATYSIAGLFSRNNMLGSGGYFLGIERTNGGTRQLRLDKFGVGTLATYAYSWVDNTVYTLKLDCNGNTITGYLDGNQVMQATDTTYPSYLYSGVAAFGPVAIFDNFKKMSYPTNSPAATHKFSIPGNNIQDIAECLDYLENSFGGTGSLSYGYQLNGGSLVSGKTLAQLKAAIRAAAITVHTDSLIVYVSHVSDGTQQVESAIKLGGGLHVEDPSGAVYCLID